MVARAMLLGLLYSALTAWSLGMVSPVRAEMPRAAGLPALPRQAGQYRDDVIRAARFYLPPVPVPWFAGQIQQESRWDGAARSRVGALGLLQIMPATARDIARTCRLPGFTTLNPRQAIRGGACYDGQLWREVGRRLPGWAGSVRDHFALSMRAYNGGAGWLLREARLLAEQGATGGHASALAGVCRRLRSPDSCRENVAYPILILRWAAAYRGWE